MRNAVVIIYSRGVLQPSGIRRFGNGVSQLSPLRPVLGNGDPLIEILQNALTFERVLQRPAPSFLWSAPTKRRALVLNSMVSAIPLWPSLGKVRPNERTQRDVGAPF